MKASLDDVKMGHGLDGTTTLGPLINKRSADKAKELVQDALDKGAKLLVDNQDVADACFVNPTVVIDATPDMRFFKEEIFGPVAPIYRFSDEADVIKMANDTDYGLAGYLYYQRPWSCLPRV